MPVLLSDIRLYKLPLAVGFGQSHCVQPGSIKLKYVFFAMAGIFDVRKQKEDRSLSVSKLLKQSYRYTRLLL